MSYKLEAKYENWEIAKRDIEDFQLKMCSQFYVRDSRTLTQAKKNNTKDSGKDERTT